jgi:hypothetical protein
LASVIPKSKRSNTVYFPGHRIKAVVCTEPDFVCAFSKRGVKMWPNCSHARMGKGSIGPIQRRERASLCAHRLDLFYIAARPPFFTWMIERDGIFTALYPTS